MKRFFLFLAALTAVISAGAEDTDSLFYNLQAIEVVAVRASDKSTSATTTLSGKELSRTNFGYDMPSMLMFTPSLVTTSEGGIVTGGCSMSIRGTDATRINVSINGMPLNNPDSHSMYWYDTPDLAGSSGNVQIVRGARTTAAGTASFGGAVNIATSSLREEFCGDASISYGSYNTGRQSVHIGSGLLGGRWVIDARVSHISSDGYIDRASTDMKSYMLQAGYFNGGTMLKFISFGGKSKTYLTYGGVSSEDMETYGRTYHTSGQYETSDGPYVLKDGTHVAYFDDQTDNYLQLNNQLILDHSFSSIWKLSAMLHYTYGYGYYRQYKDDAWLCSYNNLVSGSDQADLIRRKVMRSNTAGGSLNAVMTLQRFEMVFGASYLYYGCPHYGTIDWIDAREETLYRDFRWYDNDVTKNDASAFIKATYEPVAGLGLHAELQYRLVGYRAGGSNDNYDWTLGRMQAVSIDKRWNFLNPNLGVTWSFARRHSVGASFAMAHKEPTRADFCDRYNFSMLSEEPVPEELLDWELAYNFTHPKVEAGVNLYYMKYHNQLVPTGLQNDSEDNLNVNVDDSYRRGVEMTLLVKPLGWLSFGANATLSQNRVLNFDEIVGERTFHHEEAPIAYSPSTVGSAFVRVEAAGVEVAVRGQYVGKQYISVGGHEDLSLPGYFFGNADLAYTLPRKLCGATVRFGLRVSNFTGTRYCSYGYGGSYMDGDTRASWSCLFPQAPCNVIGNVIISF